MFYKILQSLISHKNDILVSERFGKFTSGKVYQLWPYDVLFSSVDILGFAKMLAEDMLEYYFPLPCYNDLYTNGWWAVEDLKILYSGKQT